MKLEDNVELIETLRFTVPLHIAEVAPLPFRERYRLGVEASRVVAGQGDTLQYGSQGTRFGDGARDMRKHLDHGTAKAEECEGCQAGKDTARCCMQRFRDRCGVCLRGEATYSAGEVFNFLARSLAIGACQPGGVTWGGMHWCVWPHPCCPNPRAARRPTCCTCTDACLLVTPCAAPPDGSRCAGSCRFCANGCPAADAAEPCCRRPASSPTPGPVPPVTWRPDDARGQLAGVKRAGDAAR